LGIQVLPSSAVSRKYTTSTGTSSLSLKIWQTSPYSFTLKLNFFWGKKEKEKLIHNDIILHLRKALDNWIDFENNKKKGEKNSRMTPLPLLARVCVPRHTQNAHRTLKFH
jgi:hypothetical protein